LFAAPGKISRKRIVVAEDAWKAIEGLEQLFALRPQLLDPGHHIRRVDTSDERIASVRA
jgi:hypothetical protein